MKRAVALLLAATFWGGPALADAPRFSNLFGDHAVLQRGEPVRLSGRADPATALTVEIGAQRLTTTSDPQGRWTVLTQPMTAGGPYTLSVSDGRSRTVLNDVMVGEVWFCSGQSNMGLKLEDATNGGNEIRDSENPLLRFTDIGRDATARPVEEAKGVSGWTLASPTSAGPASAVCYFMAKELQQHFGVTVGFITSTWGGTQTQAWIGEAGLRPLKTYDDALQRLAVYAEDSQAGEALQARYFDDWWTAHEPDAKAKAKWTTPGFDDSGWKTIRPTKVWERIGDPEVAGFNGAVWYRTSFNLTKTQAEAATHIALGLVDDSETTFVNGVRVGGLEGRTTRRRYALPKGVLTAGRNVVAVRVLDSGGSGGLYDTNDQRFLALADGSKVLLPEEWRYRVSATLDALGDVPLTPWDPTKGTGSLYNGMVAPVTAYTVKGVAWYQGEANVHDPAGFGRLLPALIGQWRAAFGKADLPFLVVQLPNYGPVSQRAGVSKTAEVREHQRRTAQSLSRVGLTPIIDIGDRYDIHPGQKTIVGRRLALTARRVAYGEAVSQSPSPMAVTRSGDALIVRFRDASGGLRTYSSDTAIGFEVCDADRSCRYAAATVKGDSVTLPGANRPEVRFVRYAWSESPIVNLFNSEDLPVGPFEITVE
jgi:sialate O-acetylesterase